MGKGFSCPSLPLLLELNYTSTIGRSTVILWNVPASAEELFLDGLEEAATFNSHLQGFRRVALLVLDDGNSEFFCNWPELSKLLRRLIVEGELDVQELGIDRLDSEDQIKVTNLYLRIHICLIG